MLEVSTDILKIALMAEVNSTTNHNRKNIHSRDTDYLDNIALVGKLSGSKKPVVIILKNALSTDGIKFKTKDDKDNVLPVTFTGHIDPTTPDILPNEIHFPKLS